MRATRYIPTLLLAGCTILYGCPYSSSHQLDDAPAIYTEDILMGNWAATVKKSSSGRAEPVKMILSKKTETEYAVAFTGAIKELKPFRVVKSDTIHATAFMSTLSGGTQILNIKIGGKTYLAELKYEKEKLSLLPLSEHFTSRIVKNNAALRTSVEVHYKTRSRPAYDEDFCLKNMVKVN